MVDGLEQTNAAVISPDEQANAQMPNSQPQVDTTQPAKVDEPVNWEVKYKQLQGVVQREVEDRKRLKQELAEAKALHAPLQSIQEEIRAHGERLARVQDDLLTMKGETPPAVSYVAQYQQQSYGLAEANTLNRVNARLTGVGIYNNDPRLAEASILFAEAQKARHPRLLPLLEREVERIISAIPPNQANNSNDFETKVNQVVEAKIKTMPINPELLKVETGQASLSGSGRARKPTLEDLQNSTPFETADKIDKGIWKL